jgi:hypothetical protein
MRGDVALLNNRAAVWKARFARSPREWMAWLHHMYPCNTTTSFCDQVTLRMKDVPVTAVDFHCWPDIISIIIRKVGTDRICAAAGGCHDRVLGLGAVVRKAIWVHGSSLSQKCDIDVRDVNDDEPPSKRHKKTGTPSATAVLLNVWRVIADDLRTTASEYLRDRIG